MPEQSKLPSSELKPKELSARALAKLIFEVDAPEQFIKTIPPQSLYLAMRAHGVESSADILEIATLEQCRLLLDFDWWHKHELDEVSIWNWLSLPDQDVTSDRDNSTQDQALRLLQKLIKFSDLKIIAWLIQKYVQTISLEEPTDAPPEGGYYTPDKGRTWIKINLEDANRHFLLARLLAMIFETDTELFYQLLSISSVATLSTLEEDALTEREKRLAAEGIPDREFAFELNSGLTDKAALADLRANKVAPPVQDIDPVEPLIGFINSLRPISDVLDQLDNRDNFAAELTLLVNAAIVRWGISWHEPETVRFLAEKVRGCINIGLERAIELSELPAFECYHSLGLTKLYRLGLSQLFGLAEVAQKTSRSIAEGSTETDSVRLALLESFGLPFPELPMFINSKGKIESHAGKLEPGSRAFEHLTELVGAKDLISKLKI